MLLYDWTFWAIAGISSSPFDPALIACVAAGFVVALIVAVQRAPREEEADGREHEDVRDPDDRLRDTERLQPEHQPAAALDPESDPDEHQRAEPVVYLPGVVVFQRRNHGGPEHERHRTPDRDRGRVSEDEQRGGHEERSAHPEEPEEHPDHEAEDDEEREETRSQSE